MTETEFQTNSKRYLEQPTRTNICIDCSGEVIAEHGSAVDALYGLLKDAPVALTTEDAREARLARFA